MRWYHRWVVYILRRILQALLDKDLRGIASQLQQKIGSGVVAVTSSFEGKGSLIITVSNDLTDKISAVDLVQSAAQTLGAKGGGGKPNFAQTGGPEGNQAETALEKVKTHLKR